MAMLRDLSMNQPLKYKNEDTKTDLKYNISDLIIIQNT